MESMDFSKLKGTALITFQNDKTRTVHLRAPPNVQSNGN